MIWAIEQGDVRADCLACLPDASVDAVVTDPPYELGFMGKAWDRTGVAFDVAVWKEVLRVLKPGGMLLSFGGTRTYHRVACAIEDAGFGVRDSLAWVQGQGFPKSLNVRRTIEMGLCTETGRHFQNKIPAKPEPGDHVCPARDDCVGYDGFGTALKPSFEPIVMARKPMIGTLVDNVREYGTGPINVDACRVGTDWNEPDRPVSWKASGHSAKPGVEKIAAPPGNGINLDPGGRWPPNVLLSHLESCDEKACEPGCPVAELDRQSGRSKSTKGKPRASAAPGDGYGMTHTGAEYDDQGGCSRYFPCFYSPKASRKEREAGLVAFPIVASGELTGGRAEGSAGLQSPRAGAGRSSGRRNDHPTVKPIDLMRWLVRIVTPIGGVVLDPFAGSGTTGIACVLESFDFVGFDLDPHNVDLARARIAHFNAASHPPRHLPDAGTPGEEKPA